MTSSATPSIYRITRFAHPDQPWLAAVLAWDGATPIGYGLAFDVAEHLYMPEWTRAGYIAQFLIASGYRQHGVGAALMDTI